MAALHYIIAIVIFLTLTSCSTAGMGESSRHGSSNSEQEGSNLTAQTFTTDVIKCDGREIEIFKSQGSQRPVVFINGFRMPLSNWSKVIGYLRSKDDSSAFFSYNRPGVGRSSKADEPQTGNVAVEDIHTVLQCAGITEPVVLVAHSLGGIFANLYAREYPSMVAGLVLVDAPHPDEILEQKSLKVPVVLNALNNGLKFIEKMFNPYKFSEDEQILTTLEAFRNAPPFPSIPIVVITGTKKMPFAPERAMEIHQRYQTRLLDLSPMSSHILADGSGHFPQIDQPELVSEAVLSIVRNTAKQDTAKQDTRSSEH